MSLSPLLAMLALAPQEPARIDLTAETARAVVVDRQAGQYLGHVSTAQLDNGAILAAYPMGHGKGAIVCKRSLDGGRTWSERLPVPANWSTSQETPTLFRTTDAAGVRRLLLWSGLYPARLAHSADSGTNWSELAPAGEWGGIVVMGDVVAADAPGRYLAFWHDDGRFLHAGGKATGTFALLQSETADGGLSWTAPRAIWSGSDMHLCEPGAMRLDDGTLVLLLRENRRRAPSQRIESSDHGTTWSQPQPLHPALCGDRHVVRRAPDGRLVAVFRAMPLDADKEGAAWKGDFVAWVGRDDDLRRGHKGQFAVRLLDNKDSWDCGYAGLEVLGDGTFVATTYGHWQQGEPPFIQCVRFSLAELDARDKNAPANPPDLAGDLARLQAYVPGAKAPTDAEILAATDRLQKAMPRVVAANGPLTARLTALHAQHAAALVPTKATPIRARDPLARVLVGFDDERTLQLPLDRLTAHPSAKAFPGEVPEAALQIPCGRILDCRVPGRHSTGVYARPGAVVTMLFGDGKNTPPKGLRVRIGAHSDDIHRRDSWPRMPRISRTFAVDRARMEVGNAYGGAIYVEVTEPHAGTVDVVIEDGVQAPMFVLGVTKPEEWQQFLRVAPAPWAELAAGKVTLSVPSEAIRTLDDPTAVLEFWDRVLDGAADLAARSRDRERPERYVADVEISAGYMHSGYPIMTHLDAAQDMVDVGRMRKGPWGLFHELGHNHQSRDWTFAGTGEVTVNVFSLYLCHVLCEVPWDQAWGGNLKKAKERLAECVRAGQKPWTVERSGRPDLALRLLMYSQIERAFGWEAFMHTFALYRDLEAGERPKNDDEKRDQWLVRLSTAVDRDLGPFFQAWGVPVSDGARAAVAGRSVWMPYDWP